MPNSSRLYPHGFFSFHGVCQKNFIFSIFVYIIMAYQKKNADFNKTNRINLKNRILNFKATGSSSFGDAAEWEQHQRSDRVLPFS